MERKNELTKEQIKELITKIKCYTEMIKSGKMTIAKYKPEDRKKYKEELRLLEIEVKQCEELLELSEKILLGEIAYDDFGKHFEKIAAEYK